MKRYDEVLLERGTDHVVRWESLSEADLVEGCLYLVYFGDYALAYLTETGEWEDQADGRIIPGVVSVLYFPREYK